MSAPATICEPRLRTKGVALCIGSCIWLLASACAQQPGAATKPAYRESFPVDKSNFVSKGSNRYFILEPGFRATFAHEKSGLVITVLSETKRVDGVETRVVEENESDGGKPVEISRNYFAIDKTSGDVYYFGEDVDIYKNGKVDNHEGSWLAGVNGARFGLMMPAEPKVGDRFYQELAPKVAMDRCEIAAVDAELKTPAGDFRNCVKTNESSAIESGTGHKIYAPGVGLAQDDEFVLVKVERP